MTKRPENNDKAEQKVSKDEVCDKDLQKVTGGIVVTKVMDHSSPKLFNYQEVKPIIE